MENFTPVSGLIGGSLIGLATALMMLFSGQIAGISGIVGSLFARKASEVGWRAVFVVGLLLGAFAYTLTTGGAMPISIQVSLPVIVVAGLLVGFGTRLGSGCTRGCYELAQEWLTNAENGDRVRTELTEESASQCGFQPSS